MGITANFQDVDPSEVTQNEELIRTTLENQFTTVDFSKGTVLYDLIVRPLALYMALDQVNIERVLQSSSLLEIAQNPELADDDIVDAVLSNYRVTRTAGTKAAGSITIVMTANNTTPIPEGSVFYSGTRQYVTPTSFVGVPDSSLISNTTDRLITKNSSGYYEFIIEVEAASEGDEYQLKQGAVVSADNPPPNYIKSYVTYDFTSGSSEETNAELIEKLAEGASGRTMSTRLNITSFIKGSFADVSNISIVGMGNPDMRRDRHNIFDISYGGKSDIYVQTQPRPLIVQSTMTAVLVEASTKRWQLFFSRDTFPGFYKIMKIVPIEGIPEGTDECGDPNLGSLEITNAVRTYNNSALDNGFIPDIQNSSEAAFSRFQEFTCEFKDPYTDTTDLTNMVSTHQYVVDLLYMPTLADIQDFVTGRDVAAHRYDDIVRAPIPCLVSATIPVKVPVGSAINTSTLATAVANTINDEGFSNELPASVLCSAVQSMLPSKGRVFPPIDMLGEVLYPNVTGSAYIRSSTVLRVPTDHTISVSEKTVMFFANAEDISIEVMYF